MLTPRIASIAARPALRTTGELERSLGDCIRRRSGSQVRSLRLEWRDGRVTVWGRVDSYYAKQLAIAACRELFGRGDELSIDCKLEVDRGAFEAASA